MRFLIDANMPRSIIALVASLGHEVEFARDLDFANVRRYPPSLYPGIIVLRLSEGVIAKDIVGVTERFLRDATFVGNLAGRLAIVEQDRVRFRPALARVAPENLAKKGS
jgi:hypothetical protein